MHYIERWFKCSASLMYVIKVEFMAELLYWIALDCTGGFNVVAGQCISKHSIFI